MTDPVYRRLAERLNAIPNGFPPAESGAHLRLLAKIYDPDEAAMAAAMRLTPETAETIAERAGVDVGQARRLLKAMVRKGQIGFAREERQLAFHLIPFVVGVYENQIDRMDRELAELFEAYALETRGGAITSSGPPLTRVLPVREAVSTQLDVLPAQTAADILESAKSWGVLDCICRKQQKLVDKGCDAPLESCLVYAPLEGAFGKSHGVRAISKEEALEILRQTEEAGLVHTTMNHRADAHYICNCCTCCCGVLRGMSEFGLPAAVAHSGFVATVEKEDCIACGACEARCPMGAISLPEDVSVVDRTRCIGCGLCVSVCPVEAMTLAPRPESERIEPPEDLRAWMEERAKERGIAFDAVL